MSYIENTRALCCDKTEYEVALSFSKIQTYNWRIGELDFRCIFARAQCSCCTNCIVAVRKHVRRGRHPLLDDVDL